MSAGALKKGFYSTDNGDTVKCSFQPETESLLINAIANASVTGPGATGFPSAKVSGGRTSIGINCRLIRIKFDTAPAGYLQGGIITLPVFSSTVFAGYQAQTTGTYDVGGGAQAITIVGFTPEAIR